MRSFLLAALFLTNLSGFGQNSDPAERVYKSSENSVFLVYLNDSGGNPDALGSAFLVTSNLLITNAHVVEAGSPVLAVGPVRVPLKVVRIDKTNDLAILSVDLSLVSKPLTLSSDGPSPGEQVFAVGNPEGLEKTISQGIVSGIRRLDDRDLLQITSPISHGSSGGPILNAKGEVIGVAVGMLEDGQNLNFAVPVKYVRALLDVKSPAVTASLDCSQNMADLKDLAEKRNQEDYSDDSSSQYQRDTRELRDQVAAISNSCVQPKVLEQLACLGTTSFDLDEEGIKAARKLAETRPTVESQVLLAYVLYQGAEVDDLLAQVAKDGSPEKAKETEAHSQLMREAESTANNIRKQARGNPLLVANFVLAGAKDDSKDYSDAISLNSAVANSGPSVCNSDLASRAYKSLITENSQVNNDVEAEKWFRTYASKYLPNPYEWDAEGDRRHVANDLLTSADAYERAAAGSTAYDYDYCFAANDRYFQANTDADAVLSDGRKCVDASVKDTDQNSQKYFQRALPVVYRSMADVLDTRGVYQQGLDYVRASLALAPDNPFSLDVEARTFENLEKYPECISAAQAAINASDGKYGFMHFRLGMCYFDSEDWSQAVDSFRLAADADKSDAVSAFNLGLSLQRQGFSADAQQWFREALRRNPDTETRQKITTALQ